MDAGWHPDPSGKFDQRYWDGARWTDHVARGGEMMRDEPLPTPLLRPPPRPVEKRGWRQWPWTQIVFGVIVVATIVGIIAAFAGGDDDKTVTAATTTEERAAVSAAAVIATTTATTTTRSAPTTPKEEQRYGAFDVCTKFVKDRLKAPSTAKFRNFFEKDGEVVVTSTDGVTFVVASTVDAQNSFGAMLRTSFVCTVINTGGSNWRLVDLAGI